ncbi:MAG TPA: Ig-like domain-containing protein [Plantibacter sp.]|uniref:Ig-like domain-containing protein n=1 Tax=unclassified Plantibacter TaxID=2624265 RepID=UPI002B7CBA37|nr:Ig-like domain-containing protein [Plantibacter sp.]
MQNRQTPPSAAPEQHFGSTRLPAPTTPPRTARGILSALGMTVVATAVLAGASPASAAEIPGAITAVSIATTTEDGQFDRNQTIELQADWAVPDGTPAGSTFGLQLPDELVGLGSDFPLLTADGDTVAQCIVTTADNRLDCTLTDYVTGHPIAIGGTLGLYVRLSADLAGGTTTTVEIVIDGSVIELPVTVRPDGGPGEQRPYDGQSFAKYGSLSDDGTTIGWWLTIPSPAEGWAEDTALTLTDTLGAGHSVATGDVWLLGADTLNEAGTEPAWADVAPADYQVTSTGSQFTLDFVARAGFSYAVWYQTRVAPGSTGPWENRASLTGPGVSEEPVTWNVVAHGGGGTGTGTTPTPSPTPTQEPTEEPTTTPTPEPTVTTPSIPQTTPTTSTPQPAAPAADATGDGSLASTGSEFVAPAMLGAAVLLLLGIATMFVARRR